MPEPTPERTVRLVIENVAPLGPAHTVIFDGRSYAFVRYEARDDGMTEIYELRPHAPESTADAPSPVTAATEAHGGAGEAQEAAQ